MLLSIRLFALLLGLGRASLNMQLLKMTDISQALHCEKLCQ